MTPKTPSWKTWAGSLTWPALLLATLAIGCSDPQTSEEDADAGAAEEQPQADMGAEEDAGEAAKPLTPADIKPSFVEFGPRDASPNQVIITTEAELVDDRNAAIDRERTRVVTEPPTQGRVARRTTSSIVYRPDGGFKPGRTYTVRLESIGARGKAIVPEEPWTYSFDTPPFKLLSMSSPIRLDARTVEVELHFSAPPALAQVEQFASWSYRQSAVRQVTYRKGSSASIVRAKLINDAFGRQAEGELALTLAAGLPLENDASVTSAAAKIEHKVITGPELEILDAYQREGTNGYYVEVICDDDAVPGSKRYYWDRHRYNSYNLSTSCMPDLDSARQRIEFNPKVDFELSPTRAGFRIFGDFERGKYAMTIKPGLRSDAGGILRTSYSEELDIPERKPTVNFTSKGRYIPREAWNEIAVRHLNVEELEVTVRHIPYKNLVFWLSGSNEQADDRVANVVAKEKLQVTHVEDEEQTTWVDIRQMIPDPRPGVYELEVEGRNKRDESRLLITDLNLVAKRAAPGKDDAWSREIHVWAFGMRDIKARSNVEVKAVRRSGKVLGRCTTDANGACTLELPPKDIDDSPPFALLANQGEDFTYIKYTELKTEHSSSDTYGQPYLSDARYQAVIYGDRDLYRPGDDGHFVGVIRASGSHVAPRAGLPVELVMRDSRSRVVRRKILKTNAAGVVSLDETFADFAPTGRWRMELKVGKKIVTSYSFGVEEFVPERMKVRAEASKKDYALGDEFSVDVNARYLFGGSTEGSRVDVRCWLAPATFSSPKHKDYSFGMVTNRGEVKTLDLGTASETIDAANTAQVACPVDDEVEAFDTTGTLRAAVSVFEAGSGRVTTSTATATVHPAPHYIGLKAQTRKARAGEDFKVKGVIVDWDGEPLSTEDTLEVELIRMVSEYGWYYDENYGYERYSWYRRPVREGKQTVKIAPNGTFEMTLTPREDGAAFIVRASVAGATTELEVPGQRRYYYWWSSGSSTDRTPSPEKPATVPIEAPDKIDLGEEVEVSFEAPFKGRALLTLETHRVLTQQWMDVEAGPNTWKFTVDEFVPNVYVSALVIKNPHLDSEQAFLPGRAIGVENIKVEPKRFTQEVEISAPREVRSEAKLQVRLDLGGPVEEETWATVAVVDEGILQLTKFKTPDPNSSIFARRALGVDTFDTVGWALQLEQMRGKSGGGDYDEEEEMGNDDAGLGRPKAIKPVALWSGVVKVPKSGKLDVSFDLPLYRGALRVMAITTSKSKVGRAEAEVLVRDPINVQATLPRFLTAGDEAHIPVFVTNMSGKKRDIKVVFEAEEQDLEGLSKATLPASPLVELISPGTQSLSLEDGKSGTAIFRVKGLRQAGLAKFKVIASDGDEASRAEQLVPFIPSGPRETKVTRLTVDAGQTDLAEALAGWVPTSERTTFWLTSVPYGEAFDHLKYLVRYPYGCIEQTTSSTRPLLFVRDILELVDPTLAPDQDKLDRMVRHGIRRVLSMQTSSGGFAYWPGGRYPNSWGTAYAVHMLMDARDKGYDVPRQRLDRALQWLEENVGRDTYPYAEPYMHFVLAKAKRGHKGRIKQLLKLMPKEPKGEDAERTYLLKAALHMLGDHRYEADLKSPDVSALSDERRYGYSYYSDRRRRAMTLAVFLDLFGKDAAAEDLVNLVGRSLSGRRSYWYTTQELVWGVTALGKWVEGSATTFKGAKLLVNGKPLPPTKASKKRPDITWALMRASEFDSVKLDLASKDDGKLYLVVSSEGVRTAPTVQYGGEGLALTREYFDASGEPLDIANIALGDVIYSRVTLENKTNDKIENVALVERFPAGWEIENPNLGRGQLPASLNKNLWGKEHMNMRDDRVEVFGTLYRKAKVSVVVALRATSAGAYTAPAVTAEAMYDPSKWARVRGQRVVIIGPWAD